MNGSDPYALHFDSLIVKLRAEFNLAGLSRREIQPKAERHRRMAAYFAAQVHLLSRPGYWEAPGFAGNPDWTIAGWEAAPLYGQEWRRCFLRMLRHEFLAGWFAATGETEEVIIPDRRAYPVLTGITS